MMYFVIGLILFCVCLVTFRKLQEYAETEEIKKKDWWEEDRMLDWNANGK